jgi:hypothetical protein
MIADKLKAMSRDELVTLAMQHGIPKPHHKTSEDSIIKLIMDKVTYPTQPKEEAKTDKKEPVFATHEQVEKLIAPIVAKAPNFQVTFDDESRSVIFRCNGAEDSMSLSVAPRWMAEKARIVSRGRLALRGHSATAFDPGNAGGNSAYTNVVLA